MKFLQPPGTFESEMKDENEEGGCPGKKLEQKKKRTKGICSPRRQSGYGKGRPSGFCPLEREVG